MEERVASIKLAKPLDKRRVANRGQAWGDYERRCAGSHRRIVYKQLTTLGSSLQPISINPNCGCFFQWICEIYAYNHATEMDIYPNLPAFNFLTPVSLATDSIQASPPVMNYGAFPSISETVEFPPVRVLKRVAPR